MNKILHVVAGNLFGGVESFLVSLAKSDSKNRQVDHVFAICFKGRLSKEIGESGCSVHMIGSTRFLNPLKIRKSRKRLDDVIEKTNPNIMILHMSWAQVMFGGFKKKPLSWVAHHHGPPSDGILDKFVLWTKPNSIIAPSNHSSKNWAARYGRPVQTLNYPVRKEFLENAIFINKENAKKTFGFPIDKVVILQCSRIERWKGHDILIESLGILKKNKKWIMVFGGEPQKPDDDVFLGELMAKSKSLGLEGRVKWMGNVENVAALMAASDIYCQANRGPEGFSLAFLEASFSGLPIVTTDLGGAPEIVKSNGILVSRPEPELFSESLRSLIDDEELRAKQAEESIKIGRSKGDPSTQICKYERMVLGLR